MDSPDSEYWIHEAVITRYLGLPKNTPYGPSEALTALILDLQEAKYQPASQQTKFLAVVPPQAPPCRSSQQIKDEISQLDGQMDQIAKEAMTLHQAVDDLQNTNEKKIDQSKSKMAERSWREEAKYRRRPNYGG